MAEEMLYIEAVDDGSIEVVKSSLSSGCFSLDSVGETSGDPYEQRPDIVETLGLLDAIKTKLTFKDEAAINEELDQLRPRMNFVTLFEEEMKKIERIAEAPELASESVRKVAIESLDRGRRAQKIAQEGRATLKRPLEILEEVMPYFLGCCAVSVETFELSAASVQSAHDYEQAKAEMHKCQTEFDMEGREQKQNESIAHLDKALKAAKEDSEQAVARLKQEEELERMTNILKVKGDVELILGNEVQDLDVKRLTCQSDVDRIEKANEEQTKRMEKATGDYERKLKSTNVKLDINRTRQEDLRKQLQALEEEEQKLLNSITFQKEVQSRALQRDEDTKKALTQMKTDIQSIDSKVSHMQKFMDEVFGLAKLLFDVSMITQRVHEDNLKKLEIEAYTRERGLLATAAVDWMLAANDVDENINDYKKRIKDLYDSLTLAAKRGQSVIVKKTKEDLNAFAEECKKEESKKQDVSGKLTDLKATLAQVDEKLLSRGVNMQSLDELYKQKVAEMAMGGPQMPLSLSSLINT